jgi:two-component system, cell cycle sensor histidine kinase and response regulator CckA
MSRLADSGAALAAPAEAAMREALAETILESTADAIIAVDGAGVVRSFNRSAERTFRCRAEDMVGVSAGELLHAPELERADWVARIPATVDAPTLLVGLRRDGTRFPAELVVTPFTVGTTQYTAWFVRDISDRADLEAQLRQSQKMDAMGQLAGGVAHDFNNLLTIINGWCETLASGAADERQCAIEQIGGAAARAATLTAQLLAFGRKAEISPRVVDLNQVIAEVAKMLGRVIGADVSLRIHAEPRPQFVRVDTGQMSQLLVNLAVNARDAMPRGGTLTISTSGSSLVPAEAELHSLEPGPYVCLRVADTGVGMSPDVASRIFEPFFTTKGQKGTGLGLATVYGIIRQAGGTIFVRSKPDEGAAFSILLPSVPRERSEETPAPRERQERGTETILVVEDEPHVRAIAVTMLRVRGYHVLVAGTSQEALDFARNQPGIALVVSDVVMPDESGPELVARLRCGRPALPVLYVSGYAADALIGAGDGPHAFLQKPYTGRELALEVRALLDRQREQRRSRAVPASSVALASPERSPS